MDGIRANNARDPNQYTNKMWFEFHYWRLRLGLFLRCAPRYALIDVDYRQRNGDREGEKKRTHSSIFARGALHTSRRRRIAHALSHSCKFLSCSTNELKIQKNR